MQNDPPPPFLRLPIELRYAIYDALCPRTPRSYPYPNPSPISAIDITRPPAGLLLCNRAIHAELSTYYFSRCTFRFVAQSFSARSGGISDASLRVVRCMRRAEVLLLPGTMRACSTHSSDVGASITVKGMSGRWLDEVMGLLRGEARELKVVVVSMRRVSWNHEWSMGEEMEALLRPFWGLKGRVEFMVGEVVGPGSIEDSMKRELETVLEKLNS